ncbi:hypothetical protein A2U01_0108710, partial [Trifolium medium]|nr:hypothetical protein [Trifolium medium]
GRDHQFTFVQTFLGSMAIGDNLLMSGDSNRAFDDSSMVSAGPRDRSTKMIAGTV